MRHAAPADLRDSRLLRVANRASATRIRQKPKLGRENRKQRVGLASCRQCDALPSLAYLGRYKTRSATTKPTSISRPDAGKKLVSASPIPASSAERSGELYSGSGSNVSPARRSLPASDRSGLGFSTWG